MGARVWTQGSSTFRVAYSRFFPLAFSSRSTQCSRPTEVKLAVLTTDIKLNLKGKILAGVLMLNLNGKSFACAMESSSFVASLLKLAGWSTH